MFWKPLSTRGSKNLFIAAPVVYMTISIILRAIKMPQFTQRIIPKSPNRNWSIGPKSALMKV